MTIVRPCVWHAGSVLAGALSGGFSGLGLTHSDIGGYTSIVVEDFPFFTRTKVMLSSLIASDLDHVSTTTFMQRPPVHIETGMMRRDANERLSDL